MMLRWLVSNWVREAAQQKLQETVSDALQQRAGAPLHDEESAPRPPCELAVIFALGIEAGGLVDLLQQAVTTRFQTHVERAGYLPDRYTVIVESGVGQQLATEATQAVIDLHRPNWIISAGFAGALQPELQRGHMLIADEVVDTSGNRLTIGLTVDAKATAQSRGLHIGRLLTVDQLLRTQEEKAQFGKAHSALACDMETLAIAAVCHHAKTRFMSVRVISDSMEDELPKEIERLLDQQTLAAKLGATAGAIFNRPSSVKDMWKLKEDAMKAADRLARFLTGVVSQLPLDSTPN